MGASSAPLDKEMSMSDRRENSVLFSLRELRSIEEDRVNQEKDAETARIEAERRAQEEEVRRAKEAEEAKIRAAEDRVRKERDEKERAEREAQLRLQESERRAQIEAATRLEQSRIEAEARAKVEGKKFPTGLVVGGVLGLILIAGGTMFYMVQQHNMELAKQQAAANAQREAERKALQAEREADRKKFETQQAELQAQLDKAGTDAEKATIRQRIAAAAQAHETKHTSSTKSSEPKASKPKIKTNGNDPLGGLDL